MDVLTSETCWALNNEIIKRVTSSWSLFIQLFNSQFHFNTPHSNISTSYDLPRQQATVHLNTSGVRICNLCVRMIEDNAWHWPRGRRNAEMNSANPQGMAVRSQCVRNAALQVRGELASPCEQQLQWMSSSARQIYLQRVKGKEKRDKMATHNAACTVHEGSYMMSSAIWTMAQNLLWRAIQHNNGRSADCVTDGQPFRCFTLNLNYKLLTNKKWCRPSLLSSTTGWP